MKITAEFVHGAIDGLIDKRFMRDGIIVRGVSMCDKCPCPDECELHPECPGTYFHIEDEISTMLNGLGVDNEVEAMLCFENPAVSIYAICVTFMAEGTFHTHNFVTEG